ncbi:hydroxyacylglutathione hydrolase [Clostridium saccharobutylicum]|uniref:MBL fold metallo-hydrolase n=1 Tax=Clostridium saccharobutylicum TaxID=169679 RepID=UPI000983DF57|nr:MBL fold metallo-hydrolase [Clostridium saccharobutylicum]AQS10301.1 hydroxyacylglutathione hydrolase [Clostridium saccharobutylicum]MBC2436567.1 MBL fold metallo-hydrolase [Clostridium saccharobutylicum]NSB87699.1 glyoxylase-like metal-dependent hydrolase (beta-lactamase superfamily II) [Clostridium saccharobutylicum]NYC31236.1 glyoxylase-like metal-dependent hydrolase (beta-lactamase superfamily II) [Clostridium saccharobutylicum]OOM17422.1 hydroxyacylglutathione hydrolase [Clostridium sa
MDILKIKGNTYCIDTGMIYIPFYKINDEKIIMLDTGWKREDRDGIEKVLESNNFKVSAIINSHAHIDHIGNNEYFKNKYNSIIAMSDFEALTCSSEINLKVFYGSQTLESVKEHFGHMICKTDIRIFENQDEISVCDVNFKIVHTPGHSPAHICIITPDDVAYLGDALISYNVMKGAKIPYSFILSEDMKSKAKLYDLHCSKYVVAHKGIYDNIKKLIDDNMDFYEDRAMKIYEVIEGQMTLEDVMKAVIKKFNINVNSIDRYYVIERMLKSYVEYLYDIKKLNLSMEDGFLKYSK